MEIKYSSAHSSLGEVLVPVPCHRVVMSDGSIGGYSGLPGVKQALLAAEGVDLSSREAAAV